MKTPYHRPDLTATRRGIPDPGVLVDVWLDRLLCLHEEGDPDTPEDAYDLLAGRARLLRARPELITAVLKSSERCKQLEEKLRAKPSEALLRQALELPNPQGWLEEARRFHVALEASADGGEAESDAALSRWGEQLLDDLDDAELGAWTASSLGTPDRELEEGLQQCRDWVEEHADDFLVCAVAVQAVGQTLRPDLAGFDLGLARTADKYVVLLDAQEEAETLAGGDGVSAAVARALFEPAILEPALNEKDVSAPRPWTRPPGPAPRGHRRATLTVFMNPHLAAARKSQDRLPDTITLRWQARGGSAWAELLLPTSPSDPARATVQLVFDRADGDRERFLNQPVWIGTAQSTIDANGFAPFTVAQLSQAGEEWVLRIGNEQEVWEPM